MRLREKIRLHVLTGFLGSGKSTLLRRYLNDAAQRASTAVLINEFGAVAIDHALVRVLSSHAQSLTGGCACCVVDTALVDALLSILTQIERGEIEGVTDIVLETSGMADPSRIIGTIAANENLAEYLQVANCVTCVEAGTLTAQIERFPEMGNQIACASRLVVTKPDVHSDAETAATQDLLGQINPIAQVVLSTDMGATLADVFAASDGPRATPALPAGHGARLRSFQLSLDRSVGWSAFSVWLTALMRKHGGDILRFKGVIPLADAEHALVLQSVRHRVSEPEHIVLEQGADDVGMGLVFICDGEYEAPIRESLRKFETLALHHAAS